MLLPNILSQSILIMIFIKTPLLLGRLDKEMGHIEPIVSSRKKPFKKISFQVVKINRKQNL